MVVNIIMKIVIYVELNRENIYKINFIYAENAIDYYVKIVK